MAPVNVKVTEPPLHIVETLEVAVPPAAGVPEQTFGLIPLNSSAPISEPTPLFDPLGVPGLVSLSKSFVIPPMAKAPDSKSVEPLVTCKSGTAAVGAINVGSIFKLCASCVVAVAKAAKVDQTP